MAEKLDEYRKQLAQVEAAIANDPSNPDWLKLRDDLVEVIELTAELAATGASSSQTAETGVAARQKFTVGERCQAIYEGDGQWYNAKVVALAEDGYFVTYLGYGNTAQVEFNEVRPYVRPETSSWVAGLECSAVHSSDGRWYEGNLVEVREGTALIRFQGETETSEVELDFIRPKLSAAAERKRKAEEEEAAAEEAKRAIPKSLEILPGDSEETIEKKKKKLKMFKRQEKKAALESLGEGRRSSWQAFKGKNKTIGKSKNFHDPRWDPTRDHGELAARLQIEKYSTFGPRD